MTRNQEDQFITAEQKAEITAMTDAELKDVLKTKSRATDSIERRRLARKELKRRAR